jgi:c-di-GMP-binding flagellar brake protein YcgR
MLQRTSSPTLAEGSCLWLRGLIGHPGHLRLDHHRLHFEVTGWMDRALGPEELSLDLDELDTVSSPGLDEIVRLRTREGQEHCFRGHAAVAVAQRLQALLTFDDSYEIGEKVLLNEVGELFGQGLFSARADIELTDRRLRVRPSGLEARWRNLRTLDLPLAQLTIRSQSPLRRQIELWHGESTIRLGGTPVSSVAAALQALACAEGQAAPTLLSLWRGHLHKGLMAGPVAAALSTDRLVVEADGRMEAALGVSSARAELSEVLRVEIAGWPESRLCLHTQDEQIQLGLADPQKHWPLTLKSVGRAIHRRWPYPPPVQSPDALRDLLKAWHQQVEPGESGVMAERVLQRRGPFSRSRAWFVSTTSRYLLLSEEADRAVRVWTREEVIGERSSDGQDELRLVAAGEPLDLIFLRGSAQVQRFWGRNRIQPYVSQTSHKLDQRMLQKLSGHCRLLRITWNGLELARTPEALIEACEEGLICPVPYQEAVDLPPAAPLTVELSRGRGFYRFTATLVRVLEPQLGVDNPDRARMVLLPDVLFPQNITRREDHRIDLDGEVVAERLEPGGGRMVCRFANLSAGGCALSLPESVAVGTLLDLTFPLGDEDLQVRASAVHGRPNNDGELSWFAGFQFLDLSPTHKARLRRELYRLEIKQIRVEELGDHPTLPDNGDTFVPDSPEPTPELPDEMKV